MQETPCKEKLTKRRRAGNPAPDAEKASKKDLEQCPLKANTAFFL